MAVAATAAAAQTEFPFAAGTDSSGRAQAVSDAAGRVLIESPEFPRGLWVDLVDEAGQAMSGLQVEYQGEPDSLVALRCVDPAGLRRETLLWARPGGDPLRLRLRHSEPVDLPAGLDAIDWRIDRSAEELLVLDRVEAQLAGWGELEAFLQERWTGHEGRVVVQISGGTTLAVDLTHPEPVARLLGYLQDRARESLGEVEAPFVDVLVSPYAIEEDLALLEDAIVLTMSFVLIPGSELEEWVLRGMRRSGRRWSGPVSWSEASALTRLDLTRLQIVDASPLAALTNLDTLHLGHNEIVDVSPLAALTRLEHLDLGSNEVVDVGPLAALTGLEHLDLSSNEIVDVSALAALTGLERLNLSGNPLVDVSPLTALAALEWLSLGRLYGRIADVSPLAALTHLDTLHLNSNLLVDVSPLAALGELHFLDLNGNRIEDISPLAAMTGLEHLDLSVNRLVDASPLVALPGLEVLSLAYQYGPDDRPTLDIGSLASLTGLEELHLASNELVDVGPLATLTGLRVLNLDDNYITDLAPLAGLSKLEDLNLGWNWIEDISPLASLTRVEVLNLGANGRIVDVGAVAAMTRLWSLTLRSNAVVDLGPLTGLWRLIALDLSGNQITDISPLVANNGLGRYDLVYLERNPLSDQAMNEQIPALEARGVSVTY